MAPGVWGLCDGIAGCELAGGNKWREHRFLAMGLSWILSSLLPFLLSFLAFSKP